MVEVPRQDQGEYQQKIHRSENYANNASLLLDVIRSVRAALKSSSKYSRGLLTEELPLIETLFHYYIKSRGSQSVSNATERPELYFSSTCGHY